MRKSLLSPTDAALQTSLLLLNKSRGLDALKVPLLPSPVASEEEEEEKEEEEEEEKEEVGSRLMAAEAP